MTESQMQPEGNALRVFNTLSGKLDGFKTLDPAGKRVNMYVCGPTVYDDAHLGHARCYITWDVMYRFLKFLGYDVKYVRNVTDVDDKILNRAKERGELPSQVAERNYQSFTADMQALNVLPPDEEPRATQYITEMLQGIQALIANGAAYPTADGSVYFRVSSKADYGKLSKKPLDDLKSGARVEVDPNKESPLDFALWKAAPLSDVNGWESPWPAKGQNKGWGRPGWHMECSAMNHALFGEQLDIHAGGADLIFPHHENEIAQSEAWTGKAPFARYWMHNGFVNVSGEKMSKSLGNFSTIKRVLERYDANTIRYFLLTNHYRMPVDFNEEALQAAENRMDKITRFLKSTFKKENLDLKTVEALVYSSKAECDAIYRRHEEADGTPLQMLTGELSEFVSFMQDDLNTPQALAVLNMMFKRLSSIDSPQAPNSGFEEALRKFINVFYHLGFDLKLLFEEVAVPEAQIQTLKDRISARKAAKATKNWAEADAIRNELTSSGFQLLDNKDGSTSVEKDGVEIVRV